jgi:hypothetical protein
MEPEMQLPLSQVPYIGYPEQDQSSPYYRLLSL